MLDIYCWESKFELCCYSNKLLDRVLLLKNKTKNKVNILEIKKAIYYAKKYHGNQKRKSGEPYYSHPLEVAYLVSNYIFSTNAIVTSILHDTIEDTALTKKDISIIFSPTIANQVEDLTRIKQNQKISAAESIELLWKQQKNDLLLIKIIDRLHNIQTISAHSIEKQEKIILETVSFFLPIIACASLLDLEKLFENFCFKTMLRCKNINNQQAQLLPFEEYSRTLSLVFQNKEQPR